MHPEPTKVIIRRMKLIAASGALAGFGVGVTLAGVVLPC